MNQIIQKQYNNLYSNGTKNGVLVVLFTNNNVRCLLLNIKGNLLFWSSAGVHKSKGLKKLITPAVAATISDLINYCRTSGFTHIFLRLNGYSKCKKLVINLLLSSFLRVQLIEDFTSYPHNGCKKNY